MSFRGQRHSQKKRRLLPTTLLLILRLPFCSMNILNYTSVSSDYLPTSSGSSSFNSSKNSKDNMIPLVFSPFYNNPYLKDVQAFYAKESPISPPAPITPQTVLTPISVFIHHNYYLPPIFLFVLANLFHLREKKQTVLPHSLIHIGIKLVDLASPSFLFVFITP
ncbi:hypothetical protein Tco_0735749 [Tanacetum coccineum]